MRIRNPEEFVRYVSFHKTKAFIEYISEWGKHLCILRDIETYKQFINKAKVNTNGQSTLYTDAFYERIENKKKELDQIKKKLHEIESMLLAKDEND